MSDLAWHWSKSVENLSASLRRVLTSEIINKKWGNPSSHLNTQWEVARGRLSRLVYYTLNTGKAVFEQL